MKIMKKALGILTLVGLWVLLVSGVAMPADLAWDYPSDYDQLNGWTIYYGDGTDNFNKTIGKVDITQDGTTVTYASFEVPLNLAFNVQYTIFITAYNDDGQSGPSNSVAYTRTGYVPPPDLLPPPVVGSPQSPNGLIGN